MLKEYKFNLYRIKMRNLIAIYLSIIICQTVMAQESISNTGRIYKISYANQRIEIDGFIKERAWLSAPFTEIFLINSDCSEPKQQTRAKMLWDEGNLYILFLINDSDISVTMNKHDDPLWKHDAVEVFIDPEGDGLNYMELQINPFGTVTDLILDKAYKTGGRGDYSWDVDSLKTGIKITSSDNKRGWICELAVPFHSIKLKYYPPKQGDVWKVNLCRVDKKKSDVNFTEISAWNGTCTDSFHVPEKFGTVIFSN